jgi:hypothetical protein
LGASHRGGSTPSAPTTAQKRGGKEMIKYILREWLDSGFLLTIVSLLPLGLGICEWVMYKNLFPTINLLPELTKSFYYVAIGHFFIFIVLNLVVVFKGIKEWLSDEPS